MLSDTRVDLGRKSMLVWWLLGVGGEGQGG